MTIRQALYSGARLLGWVEAARRGRLPQRATNVVLGRLIGRATSRIWR